MDLAHVLTDAVVARAIGAALSVVLLAGAWQKLRDRELFQAAVENYQLVPESLLRPVAIGLPLIELAASDDRNFVKKGVSWALRAIGGRSASLKSAATTLARKLATSEDSAARWIGKDALRSLT